ncbi:MAG: flagellar biosynthesis anti-sigma factor FlgM [Treponema sp.]|nr:flagellar biosynthesis anti-sigma factor FlgM [Treponema sp.]
MMIDKVSGVNPLNNLQNVRRSNAVGAYRAGSDEISVSDEAKELAESYYLNQVAAETPDVRSKLIEQVKLKIQDPNYLSPATIAATADRIMSAYGL